MARSMGRTDGHVDLEAREFANRTGQTGSQQDFLINDLARLSQTQLTLIGTYSDIGHH